MIMNIKKMILLLAAVLSVTIVAYAGDGTSCENAIYVDTAYTATLGAGEYWFMAETPALPLTLYYYPENENDSAPEITIDLSCTTGVYEDPEVARMVSMAENYGLSFPMKYKPKAQFDANDKLVYILTFDESYRNMLFNEGVTYAIPAYVHVVMHGSALVRVVSTSTFSQCSDNVNTLGMNAALQFMPEDSLITYIWPIGEWIHERYRFTWEGDGKLEMFTGEDCTVTRTKRVRNWYVLPDDQVVMTPTRASDWIKDMFQTDLYVRFYARSKGVLRVTSYEEKAEIKEMVMLGIPAVIDHENLLISCILPYGSATRAAAIKAALDNPNDPTKESYIIYTAYEGEKPEADRRYTTLTFGAKVYTLDVSVAKAPGSTDASLKSVKIDGMTMVDFNAAQLEYDDVEVDNIDFLFEAVANDTLATVSVKRATGLPGKTEVTVTAETGNTQVYVFNMIKTRSRNTKLESITVDGEPLADFSPEQLYYRMYAMNIPVVEAVAADAKSTVLVDQAKGIPGFAQIFVTAEAGNTDIYTINFTIDPSVIQCAGSAIQVQLNTPVSLQPADDPVLRLPIGKPSLETDENNWAGQRISLTWGGNSNLKVYVGTTCLYNPLQPDKTLIDSLVIKKEKGTGTRVIYLTPQQTQAWGKQSIDGGIYLRFQLGENANLTAATWEPNCQNTSMLIDINDELYLPTGHNSENNYFFYLPDWKDKDVKLTWEGQSNMTIYTAYQCGFKLQSSGRPIVQLYQFQSSDSKELKASDIAELTRKTNMYGRDFLYIRFWTDGLAGTLRTEQTGGPVTRVDDIAQPQTLSWQRQAEGIEITSAIAQLVQVYSLQGILVAERYMRESESLVLPMGMYIIRGEQETGKAF